MVSQSPFPCVNAKREDLHIINSSLAFKFYFSFNSYCNKRFADHCANYSFWFPYRMFGVFDNGLVCSPSLIFLYFHLACFANLKIVCNLGASFHRELKFTVYVICTESQNLIGMHALGSCLSSVTN